MGAFDDSGYRNHIIRNDHSPGEYAKQIDYLQSLKTDLKSNEIQQLGKLIYSNYRSILPERNTRQQAFELAKILGGFKKSPRNKIVSKDKKREIMKEAISKGVIWRVQFKVPWHPAVYKDEARITTYPFQHKYCVLYSGRNTHDFFQRNYMKKIAKNSYLPDKVDKLYNPDSVLEQGYISGGNYIADTNNKEKKGHELWSGIYFSASLSIARKYSNDNAPEVNSSRNTIIECEIPTSFLLMSNQGHSKPLRNLKDMHSTFGSPESFELGGWEFVVSKTAEINDDQVVHLPINFINGVYDSKFFPKTPHLIPLQTYAKKLHEEYPNITPDPSQLNLKNPKGKSYTFRRETQKENYEKVKKNTEEIEAFRQLVDHLKDIDYSLKDLKRYSGSKLRSNDESELLQAWKESFKAVVTHNQTLKNDLKPFVSEIIDNNSWEFPKDSIEDIIVEKNGHLHEYDQNLKKELLQDRKKIFEDWETGKIDSVPEIKREEAYVLENIVSKIPYIIVRESDIAEILNSVRFGRDVNTTRKEIKRDVLQIYNKFHN